SLVFGVTAVSVGRCARAPSPLGPISAVFRSRWGPIQWAYRLDPFKLGLVLTDPIFVHVRGLTRQTDSDLVMIADRKDKRVQQSLYGRLRLVQPEVLDEGREPAASVAEGHEFVEVLEVELRLECFHAAHFQALLGKSADHRRRIARGNQARKVELSKLVKDQP